MELKTFVISTSADPQNTIKLTTDDNVVILDNNAGVGIISDSRPSLIIGGEF